MSMPIIGTWALKALGWRRAKKKRQGDEEDRREELARTEQWILVRRRHNLELLRLGVITEPSPPAALNTGGGRIHLLLERIDRAEVALERSLQLALLELTTALLRRREVFPEQRMVDVAFFVRRVLTRSTDQQAGGVQDASEEDFTYLRR
jgi:hypothetical protein